MRSILTAALMFGAVMAGGTAAATVTDSSASTDAYRVRTITCRTWANAGTFCYTRKAYRVPGQQGRV